MVRLSPAQQRCVDIAHTGANMVICGHAGSGKSVVLREILKQMVHKAQRKGFNTGWVAPTGTTGVAGLLVGGSTLNRWAGFGLAEDDPREKGTSASKWTKQRVRGTHTLLLDEASMFSAYMLAYLDEYLRGVNQRERAFGGIQVILVGDVGQLPPVCKRGDTPTKGQFFFESPLFSEYFKRGNVRILRQNFRQRADPGYAGILGRAADGLSTARDLQELMQCSVPEDTSLDGRGPLLKPTNAKADEHNQRCLRRLPGALVTFEAACKLMKKDEACGKFDEESTIKSIIKAHIAPEKVHLKPGAAVVLLANVDPKRGLVNGTTGTVEACDGETGAVRFAYTFKGQPRTVEVLPHTWEHKVHRVGVFAYTQIPLNLAWACTVHKSQGMTMDRVCVFPEGFFAPGMGYVALSRVRAREGLTIVGEITLEVLEPDARALEFYEAYAQ